LKSRISSKYFIKWDTSKDHEAISSEDLFLLFLACEDCLLFFGEDLIFFGDSLALVIELLNLKFIGDGFEGDISFLSLNLGWLNKRYSSSYLQSENTFQLRFLFSLIGT